MEEKGFPKHLINNVESWYVDNTIQVQSTRIISKTPITIYL
jgi:hypothetical protein